MSRFLSLTAFLAVATATVTAAEDNPAKPSEAAKAEMAKMEGVWTIEESLKDGNPAIPEEQRKEARQTIKEDKRTIKIGDMVVSEATYTLDPSAKPKRITVKVAKGPLEGKEYPGIYELDGDNLKIIIRMEGKDPPKDFKSTEGSNTLLQVYKRVKEKKGK
jgi:uncharacterized protein (TIGR03067 family)